MDVRSGRPVASSNENSSLSLIRRLGCRKARSVGRRNADNDDVFGHFVMSVRRPASPYSTERINKAKTPHAFRLLQPPVPAYAGTEGCYEMLVFFLFFLFNA